MSKFAVSRALTGKPGVSEHTREMIVRTAGQLGYFRTEPKRYPGETQISTEMKPEAERQGTILILFLTFVLRIDLPYTGGQYLMAFLRG